MRRKVAPTENTMSATWLGMTRDFKLVQEGMPDMGDALCALKTSEALVFCGGASSSVTQFPHFIQDKTKPNPTGD